MGAKGAATAANWAGTSTLRDESDDSQESQPIPVKFSRYRSLRDRSVSSTASTGSRLATGNTISISSIRSNGNSNSDNQQDDQQQPHLHGSVGSGQQQQQQQRHSTTLGNPVSRSMSMSRYRRRTNNVSVSGDATQTAQKFNVDPPPRPACVDNAPRVVVAVPPVPTIPRALRRRSSGSSDESSNSPFVPNRSRSGSTRRTTEQKEEGHHADATKVSLDLPSPPSPPPPSSVAAVTPAPPTTPPRRRRLHHTSDANSRGHDIAPLRSRMEMKTMENYRQSQSQSQSRPSTAAGDENQQRQRKMIDLSERRSRLREEQEGAAKGNDEAARLEAETHRLLAEQKKKDLERLQVQLANSHQATVQAHKAKSPVIEKFAFLTKVRKHKNDLSPGLSPTTPSSATASISEFSQRTATIDSTKAMPTGIEAGGRGIVPQTDAPASAINSGDRTVTVRCRHHTFYLDVTPETTTVDILAQTSKRMTYDLEIGPSSCVVIESYISLGLERRLRRYEHIRDVMNSWDQDSQNCLVVAVAGPEDSNQDLDVASVANSEQPPSGFQLYMYHSNRPGKWNKRWVTLLENGQIICAKKANVQPTDKEASSLCRLSDYDMYTPTEAQMRRHLKPPKKHCFAVKSQQKTTVFMNTENFVQLFCTEDPSVADCFRECVQGWRSWYLVDRRPETRKNSVITKPKPATVSTATSSTTKGTTQEEEDDGDDDGEEVSIPKVDERAPQITLGKHAHAPKKSINVAAMNGHRLKVSVDESPYKIGEFEPLLDMKRFDKRLSQFGKDFLPTPSVPDVSTMPKGLPAHIKQQQASSSSKADPQKQQQPKLLIDTIKPTNDDSAAFTGSGLLGEGYEERRQAQTHEAATESRRNQHHHNHNISTNTNSGSSSINNATARSRSSTTTNATSSTAVTVTEGPFTTDGPTLLNTKPPPPIPALSREPDSPASSKPESPSWFPSALEHSAKQRSVHHQHHQQQHQRREQQFQRPSTSAGVVQSSSRRPSLPFQHLHARPPTSSGGSAGSGFTTNGGVGVVSAHPNPLRSSPYLSPSSGAMSHSNRRERPKPLVNLDGSNSNEQPPPQWREKGGGRGVAVPEGMNHIIDLISVSSGPNGNSAGVVGGGGGGNLQPPPSSAPPTRQHHHHHHRHPPPPLPQHQQRYHGHDRHHHHHKSSSGSSSGGGGGGDRGGGVGSAGGNGGYLVDKIASPPPRSALRTTSSGTTIRGNPHSAPLPLSRTRSKTAGAPPPISLRARNGGGGGAGAAGGDGAEAPPPLPPLPLSARAAARDSSGRLRDRERDREREREKEKEKEKERKEREYRDREAAFNAVPGRTGTLKVV